jgi:signal peptide peptidase SppA
MRHEFQEMFTSTELFVDQSSFRAWLAAAQQKAAGLLTGDGVQTAMQAYEGREQAPRLVGDVAVIDVCGPIVYKGGWASYYYGACAIADLQTKFRMALADPAVKTILFRFDSPGGEVTMVPEFADEIFAARGQKPIVAVADTLVASAAYWLGAQVETIYASVSARLGSIGVYTEHVDYSGLLEKNGIAITLISYGAHKTDGHPYAPLPEDVRARIQARVNEVGAEFDAAVARGRKVSKKDVVDSFGQGEVFRGKQAIALGMADKLGTFSQVLARLTKNRPASGLLAMGQASAADLQASVAVDDEEETPEPSCKSCKASGCDCTESACEEDCPTCTPECGCRKAAEEGQADEEAARAASTLAAVLAAE